MPPLPKDRVIKSRPFQNVGCDFMGPFTSKTLEKMYVCLYTCLTTRAVHLEVVENLSAGAFLNCFVRFVSRRGVPEIVRSDCGTNFKLGEVIITKMFCDLNENGRSLMSYCASQQINWIFNPPGSPWVGGAWERLVGLTKKAFNKSIGRKRLSFADMCTVITRIEAILNTRPLTKLNSSDIAEIPLRPIDFLKGNFNYSLPSTGDKAEPVPPLPKSGTRGHMWSEVWKLWPWPQFSALLLQKTAATHEAAIQEVSTLANRQRRHRHQQATSRHHCTCTKPNSQDTISNPLTQRQPATHATP